MNEVEKMYENTGIKLKAECTSKVCIVTNPHKDWCNKCESLKHEYPPFTAERQIRIIEWLGNSKAFFDANETIFSLITNHKNKNGVVKGYEGKGNSVDSCLASLINNLWQDLTEEEKAEIKNILERR